MVIAVALSASLMLPSTAVGESAAQLKARLDALQAQTRKAGSRYSSAYWRLDETEVRLTKTNRRLAATRKKLAASKKRLNMRANGMYRRSDLGSVELLLGSSSFQQMVMRLEFIQRVGEADAHAVAEVKALQSKLLSERKELSSQRKQRSRDVKRLRAEKDRLNKKLGSLEREFRRVKAQLDAARSGGRRPSGVASVAGPNGMVFPVVGSYYYANTWGASRSGGRRRHKGTDIMARHGTPCVAVLSGTVTSKTGGLGGKTIWLRADNGWAFYYAHLQGFAVTSGRVKAGQIIGYVGSTGNASGGAPHLHFQIHPGGGAPVNPYPYLRRME